MLGEVRTVYRLAAMMSGLCLLLSACATPDGMKTSAASAQLPNVQPRVVETSPSGPAEAAGVEIYQVPAPQAQSMAHIAVLLPVHSETLGAAAAAVRDGFMAAAQREPKDGIAIEIIASGDTPEEILASYGRAVQSFDIVVGPLARSGVRAIAQGAVVARPTIALAQADIQDEATVILPRNMLSMGISIEDDARQMADRVHAKKPIGKPIVLASPTAWQRRAAKAFADRWQQLGNEWEFLELEHAAQGPYLGANGLIQLQKRLQLETPSFLFSALDAVQTRQMRMLIGTDIPVYGTSQLNPFTMRQWSTAEPQPKMNGVRFVDMPWLLQADHPAVIKYSSPSAEGAPPRDADLERLYAVGIDAYQIAEHIALGKLQFQIDGATGKLRIDLNKETGRFERIELPAVYREGRVEPAGATQ